MRADRPLSIAKIREYFLKRGALAPIALGDRLEQHFLGRRIRVEAFVVFARNDRNRCALGQLSVQRLYRAIRTSYPYSCRPLQVAPSQLTLRSSWPIAHAPAGSGKSPLRTSGRNIDTMEQFVNRNGLQRRLIRRSFKHGLRRWANCVWPGRRPGVTSV